MSLYKEGNLKRQGSIFSLTGKELTYKNTKVILQDDVLKLYEGTTPKDKLKKTIALKTVKVVEFADDLENDGAKYMFQVVYQNKELDVVYITCDSADDRQEWVESIRKAAAVYKAEFLTKYHSGIWKKNIYTCCKNNRKDSEGCQIAATTIATSPQHDSLSRYSHSINTIPEQKEETGRFLASSSYKKQKDSELDLIGGEEYEVVSKKSESRWLCKNKDGIQGYAPSQHLTRQDLGVFSITKVEEQLLYADDEEMDEWSQKLKICGFFLDEIRINVQKNIICVHVKHKETTDHDWDLHEMKRYIEIPNNVNGDELSAYLDENILCIVGPYVRDYDIPISVGKRKRTPPARIDSETSVKSPASSENQEEKEDQDSKDA